MRPGGEAVGSGRRQRNRPLALLGVFVMVAGAVAASLLAGRADLALPPAVHPGDWGSWLRAVGPVVAAFAVLRLAVIALGSYLALVIVLTALATAPRPSTPASRLLRAVLARVAPAVLLRTLLPLTGVAVLAASPVTAGATPAPVFPPAPAATGPSPVPSGPVPLTRGPDGAGARHGGTGPPVLLPVPARLSPGPMGAPPALRRVAPPTPPEPALRRVAPPSGPAPPQSAPPQPAPAQSAPAQSTPAPAQSAPAQSTPAPAQSAPTQSTPAPSQPERAPRPELPGPGAAMRPVRRAGRSPEPAHAPGESQPGPGAPAPPGTDAAGRPAAGGGRLLGEGRWIVRPGDSLWSIAESVCRRHGVTDRHAIGRYWWRVVERNRPDLPVPADPDLLFPGDIIVLPAL